MNLLRFFSSFIVMLIVSKVTSLVFGIPMVSMELAAIFALAIALSAPRKGGDA